MKLISIHRDHYRFRLKTKTLMDANRRYANNLEEGIALINANGEHLLKKIITAEMQKEKELLLTLRLCASAVIFLLKVVSH